MGRTIKLALKVGRELKKVGKHCCRLLVLVDTTICWNRMLLKIKDGPKACLGFPYNAKTRHNAILLQGAQLIPGVKHL